MNFSFANAIFWVAVACCTVAQIAIIRSAIVTRPSPSASSDEHPLPASNRLVEVSWAVLPGVALAFLFVKTWQAMR
jgi:heme/copper-type cytochrome/quinol oxidase subunit 2